MKGINRIARNVCHQGRSACAGVRSGHGCILRLVIGCPSSKTYALVPPKMLMAIFSSFRKSKSVAGEQRLCCGDYSDYLHKIAEEKISLA